MMKEKEDIGFVLIHGAGLGSFIWGDLQPLLHYPSLAIDFPNRNMGDKANANLTFQAYTESVIEQTENWNKKKFILVVHSIAGCVGVKVAEHFESNMLGFVAISAAIPLNKMSFVSCLPFPKNLMMPIMLSLFGTKPSQKSIEKDLCNDLKPDQTEKIVRNFTPEAPQLYMKRVSYKPIDVPSLYIQLTKDKSLPLSTQEKMAHNLKATKTETIPGGHLPMLSHAKEVADLLNRFSKETIMT
jgi:pimeloyl-ACP methyl ester carboxylesterase